MLKVKKKSGRVVSFDPGKVFQVVMNALDDADAVEEKEFNNSDTELANEITSEVQDFVYESQDMVSANVLQDAIYGSLIDHNKIIAAREYLHYSDKKMQLRADNQSLINAVDKVFSGDPKVAHDNGNKDSRILPTKRDLVSSQVFRERGLKMYPEKVQKAHNENYIYLHDLDMSPLLPYTNCCNVNIEDMLKNGFKLGETLFTQPHSIRVAANLVSIIIQSVSLEQYGGTSIPNVDEALAPYARMDYNRHVKEQEEYKIADDDYAWKLTQHDIYEAMQGLENNINSLTGNGNQVPFSTVSIGNTDEPFATEIQKAMLKVRIKGINGKSAIFPKLIVFISKGINLNKEDPNYDVKQLALKCSSLRDYPDIVFTKNILNITGAKDKPMTPMGCVSGKETVSYIDENGKIHDTTICQMYDNYKTDEKLQPNGLDKYIDLKNVRIRDSHTGASRYVKCFRVIKNRSKKWLELDFFEHKIKVTVDHPFEVIGRGRVRADQLNPGDTLLAVHNNEVYVEELMETKEVEGSNYSYDVTTASDYFDVSGIVSHNCRSFLPAWTNPETGKEQVSGRLNMGVVTLNLVKLALESKGSKEKFWSLLHKYAETAHTALRYRIDRVRDVKPSEAPVIWMEGAIARLKADDDVTPVLKNGRCTASLGYIGIYEAIALFYGLDWEDNKEAKKMSEDIVKELHNMCKVWYNKEKYYYSLYSTPSETLADKFCSKDNKKYGNIKDITDKGFYVNSFHYAEWKDVSPFVKLNFEEPYPHYASGGFINYVEYSSEIKNNLKALEAVWDFANDIGIGYLGTNCPISKCLKCGFSGMIEQTPTGYHCPNCGNEELGTLQIVIRICGYLSSLSERPVVEGRMKEMQSRVYHNMQGFGIEEPEDEHVLPQFNEN